MAYNTNMKFAQRLKELRTDKSLSQNQLADATGLSQSSIARWELSQSEPTVSEIIILCKFFGESSDYVLGLAEH